VALGLGHGGASSVPRGQDLALMRDHGCQPTAGAFVRACATLAIHQACTSDNTPKGNPDTARVMRTLKEECLWPQEWTWPFALITALERGIATYNAPYLHSALGPKTPRPFERAYPTSHGTPCVAA
jgi:putative transposase